MADRSPDSISPAEGLFADWLARRESEGADHDFESLCRQHPEEADELRRLWVYWDGLRIVLEKGGFRSGARSLAERIQDKYGPEIDPNVSLDAGEVGRPPSDALLRRLAEHTFKTSRYKLHGEIARGGMGAILKVFDEDLRRNLAMKVILGRTEEASGGDTPPVDRRLLARFLEEAQVTGQLDHPGIVPVHELGLDADGHVFFTMKLVKGRDLKLIFDLVLAKEEGWNETRALGVLLKVCEAMAYAHKKGVIHRDLKPANVMVGSFGEVYVMDWGLARVHGRADQHDLRLQVSGTPLTTIQTERKEERADPDSPLCTMDGDVVGTPAYMAPEQAQGKLEEMGPHTDVYAVGAMLYNLLAGRMPYAAPDIRVTNRTVLAMLLQGPPTPLASIRDDIPVELAAICEKAMARDWHQRYSDMAALAADLSAFLEQRVVRAYETGAWAETRKWLKRNKPMAASLVAAVLALIAGLAVSLVQKRRADESAAAAQEQEHLAREERRQARWQAYVASLRAAEAALDMGEPPTLRRNLQAAPEEYRHWEWRYLDAQSDTSLLVLAGHESSVTDASFSPDGERILTASWDKTARVWDADTGAEVFALKGHSGSVCASFSPDGTRIVTGSNDGIRFWKADTGDLISYFPATGEEDLTPRKAILTADGGTLFFLGLDSRFSHVLKRIDAASGAEVRVLSPGPGRGSGMADLALSARGDRLLLMNDNSVDVLNAVSGDKIDDIEIVYEHSLLQPTAVAFGSDDALIATASNSDNALHLWDAHTLKPERTLFGHRKFVVGLNFSNDSRQLVSASMDETARVWSMEDGRQVSVHAGHAAGVASAAFSRDGQRLVTASYDSTARVWSAQTRADNVPAAGRVVGDVCLSPDGRRIITGSGPTAQVWDTLTGACLLVLRHPGEVREVRFSHDGLRIATTCMDEIVRVWDAYSGAPVLSLPLDRYMSSIAFATDGLRLATASGYSNEGSRIQVWSLESGREIRSWEAPYTQAVAFSPDGRLVMAGGFNDRTIRTWSAVSGDAFVAIRTDDQVLNASYSRDGRLLVTAHNNEARVWDASTGAQVHVLTGHQGSVHDAGFSADGLRIVTASSDATVRVWDAATGTELARLRLDENPQPGFAGEQAFFSPDDERILARNGHGEVRIWDSVRLHERERERAELTRARSRAEELVASLADDPEEAARRILDDARLEAAVRHAALNLISERSNRVQEEASAWVDDLRREVFLSSAIVAAIDRDENRSAGQRAAARQIAQHLGDAPHVLEDLVWEEVRFPATGPGRSAQALSAIEKAAEARAQDWRVVRALGVAQYRFGRFEDAIRTIERARELATPDEQADHPSNLAFLALARFRNGEVEQASELLRRLREVLPEYDYLDKEEYGAILEEVESVVGER